jgi:multisubunit Na+/H+ antiporter MnhE subunit
MFPRRFLLFATAFLFSIVYGVLVFTHTRGITMPTATDPRHLSPAELIEYLANKIAKSNWVAARVVIDRVSDPEPIVLTVTREEPADGPR